MNVDVYWAKHSPYCCRALLALELKQVPYVGREVQTDLQEHKAPWMLAMNPRGRLPVVKVDDYVVFESLAILYYLDLRFPEPSLMGHTPEEAGVIMRVINEFQAYTETGLMNIVAALERARGTQLNESLTQAMHRVAGEARTIESRLAKGPWIVGERISAADLAIYPCIYHLHRALMRPEAGDLSARFLPAKVHYPHLADWMQRVEALPGFERVIRMVLQ
jgi:glutathione S-transferase